VTDARVDEGVDEHEALLGLALEVAREAATLVRDRRREHVEVAETKSSDTDVVTLVDQESETLIRSRLRGARPDDGFLGEEGHDEAGSSGVRWVVDPIDGTVNFLYGLAPYAVSIAAERDGTVVAGVVVEVTTGTEYTAVRATGTGEVTALRDGALVGVRAETPLSQRLVATGFSYRPEIRALQAAAVARLLPVVRDVRRMGSSAVDICRVADGSYDAYVEEGLHAWDYSAAALVAEGAGARVELATGVGGMDLVICAPEHGFRTFREAVGAAGFLPHSGE
jgi:myo-inositol-1(or 4)-monophosphatase